jgi:hypothetical protein
MELLAREGGSRLKKRDKIAFLFCTLVGDVDLMILTPEKVVARWLRFGLHVAHNFFLPVQRHNREADVREKYYPPPCTSGLADKSLFIITLGSSFVVCPSLLSAGNLIGLNAA